MLRLKISKEKIIRKLQLMNASLMQDFGIDKPRIAVLGLNPHAGDGGVIGNEEVNIILPAVQEAKKYGTLPYLALIRQTASLHLVITKKFDGVFSHVSRPRLDSVQIYCR